MYPVHCTDDDVSGPKEVHTFALLLHMCATINWAQGE
jgi:hypothetical protein